MSLNALFYEDQWKPLSKTSYFISRFCRLILFPSFFQLIGNTVECPLYYVLSCSCVAFLFLSCPFSAYWPILLTFTSNSIFCQEIGFIVWLLFSSYEKLDGQVVYAACCHMALVFAVTQTLVVISQREGSTISVCSSHMCFFNMPTIKGINSSNILCLCSYALFFFFFLI